MANTFAPFGFRQYAGTGSSPTYEQVQMAVSSLNTGPIYYGDPVVQAANATGVGTGFVTQGYAPVVLTVGATGLATNATGSLTVTFTAPSSGVPTSPNTWAPPIGSQIVIAGATAPTLNGIYTVASSTTTTAVCVASSSAAASATSTASGVVTCFVPVAGIFYGCKYLSAAQKRTVWGNYWPGSDSNPAQSVTAYVVNDPNAQFLVQTGNSNTTATAVGFATIGNNIGYQIGTGTAATGVSGAYVDQYALTAPTAAQQLYPFRVLNLANYTPDGSNPLQSIQGNDYTNAYNYVVVGFNNSMNKQLFGI